MYPRITLNCYDCSKEKLSDMGLVFDALSVFPEKLGLPKIMPPYVFKYEGEKPEDWGLSGTVLIDGSHVTINTFPDKGQAAIGIFSHKDVNPDFAASFMSALFNAKDLKATVN